MGGGYYDREVYAAPAHRGASGAAYSAAAEKALSGNTKLHKEMDPKKYVNKLESDAKHPIIFALDVTGSMGNWTKVRKS